MSKTCTIGYPRIGPNREMKKALERVCSFWKKAIQEPELFQVQQEVEADAWKAQKSANIDLIGVDSTLYDQVLDMTCTLGLIPERFKGLQGLELYFALARGHKDAPALDMSKYFNTNYHYLLEVLIQEHSNFENVHAAAQVPEISNTTAPKLEASTLLAKVKRAQAILGNGTAVPMIIGPVTMARLASLTNIDVPTVVSKLVPLYQDLLKHLKDLSVPEVQVLEPALVMHDASKDRASYEGAYKAFSGCVPINLVTFYDDLGECYEWAVALPVQAISIDFVGTIGAAQPCRSLEHLKAKGFPAEKILGAGIVDGRSVWADTGKAAALLADIRAVVKGDVRVQHLPINVDRETKLDANIKKKLAFAVQKLAELKILATTSPSKDAVQDAANKQPQLDPKLFSRPADYQTRRKAQFEKNPNIPAFPTTTIGSFPQTKAVRKVRADFKAGHITKEEYDKHMDSFICKAIGIQEGIGIDVLVHGEPERSDMVEFFGVCLDGFEFTEHAWVQSYGSRYVRPPIICGDVKRTSPMTVREFKVAQSVTELPVKGMLTGPVTMLNWSFARSDVSRSTTAFQLALAIREEVADLEAAGCSIIQVDEPALREGLPLKRDQWDSYLQWAVDAFRLATAVAQPATQLVTHLCYSEFADILPAIDRLDADVLTIENSRSGDAMIRALNTAGYSRDLGAGVYDVHSPVVPTVDFVRDKVNTFLNTGILGKDARRIWVNPDCGLKTRDWAEVLPSLRNLVAAAQALRAAT